MQPTRAQQDLKLAHQSVSEVQAGHPNPTDATKKIYQQLCKQFPIMVIQCGLCQTLAFHADKGSKTDERGKAHQLILKQAASIMKVENALQTAQTCDALTYMHFTRRILEAWVFVKRFAVSALEIENEVKPDARTA
jgi:CRISPR-associated protein Cmr5